MTDDSNTDDAPAADEITKRIQQSADSIRLETQVKRGESTRDEVADLTVTGDGSVSIVTPGES